MKVVDDELAAANDDLERNALDAPFERLRTGDDMSIPRDEELEAGSRA